MSNGNTEGRDPVPQEVHERGWQWRPVGDGAFAPPFGTIRACIGCDALVAGGPTRCARCAQGVRSLRWPFRETWRTYDHVMFWVYTVGCICLGGLLYWAWPR